jgi:hypothetical protein
VLVAEVEGTEEEKRDRVDKSRTAHNEETTMVLEMEGKGYSEAELLHRLERHPRVKAREGRLLDLIENTGGDLKRADDAERRAIEELRKMGQELLQDRGQGRAEEEAKQLERQGQVTRQLKKTVLAQHLR